MDIDTFDSLYRQLAPAVFRRAFMLLNDEDEARDCVQSAFLALWERRDSVETPAAFVNTIVTNKVNNYYRSLSARQRFMRLYPIEAEGIDESGPNLGEILAFIDTQLSEAVSRVVRCVFLMKLSYRQTAETLGISESTVNKHIVTALRTMRKHFNTPITN